MARPLLIRGRRHKEKNKVGFANQAEVLLRSRDIRVGRLGQEVTYFGFYILAQGHLLPAIAHSRYIFYALGGVAIARQNLVQDRLIVQGWLRFRPRII